MNWFAYRLPGETETVYGSSERLLKGFGSEPGFVVAPFDGNPDHVYTIPDDHALPQHWIPRQPEAGKCSRLPQRGTSHEEHLEAVKAAISRIKAGELEKCVIARVIVSDLMVDVNETFIKLCDTLPDAFVFAFESEPTGLWLGASPETLVAKQGREFGSIALAGTRKSGIRGKWDEKNIHEQEVVCRFIRNSLQEAGLVVETGETYTRKAGPVEHIATELSATCRDNVDVSLRDVAALLSPTPALSGFPRSEAVRFIKETEGFNRTYYGGYCGPVDACGDGRLFVNLRSMRIESCSYCLYAGGGIMAGSDPEAEWEETNRKADTLQNSMVYMP